MGVKIPIPGFLKSVKYVLGAVNIVFLLTGVLLLLAGIVVLAIYSGYEELITNKFFAVPSFVIATGIIILLISVLGFYAAYSKQFYFVAGYAGLMLVVLVFEASIVIVAYQIHDNAASDIRPVMVESVNQYENMMLVAEMWDELHRYFRCCGAVNRFDFMSNRIPISCCYIDHGTISPFTCTPALAYTIGCAEPLGELLSNNAFVLAVCAVVATCLQVPLTCIACWMAWRVKFEDIDLEY